MGHSMAGDAGLEPTHARVKVWCLTDLANPQQKIGVPEGSRTPDTRLRRAVLYPAELQAHNWSGRRDSNPRPSPWQGDALPLSHFRVVVRLEGLEPPRTGRQILSLVRLPIPPQPHFNMEATSRFELEMKELQSSALPLGYVAILLIF